MNKTQLKKKFSWNALGPYVIAYLLPVTVMLIVFIQRGIWPFGDRCFLRTDLYHQYAPFYQEFRDKLQHGGSLFYSWRIGSGTNFWAIVAYYLSSPLNFLLFIVPQKFIIEYITGMIVTKLGLMSVTMTWYLNHRHGKKLLEAYPAAFFGAFYALSGYTAAYNWNIMWLDCLWLFPLVILGLEKLVHENRGLLYCVTLGLTILSNYYIAVMVCMGVAVYCFFLLGTEKEMQNNFGKKLLKFAGCTFIAVLFSSVLLIPYIKYFSMTASAEDTFTWKWYSYFSVFDMLSRQLFSVECHTGLDHWPNIYCGIAFFLGIPLYYMNKKILLREKIGYTVVLIFFYFSFSTRAMDYIWHVFHIPNSLPCRQSFIYVFLVLVMCYRGFLGLKDRTYREITAVMLLSLAFIVFAEKLETDEEYFSNYVFYGSACFVMIYTWILYAYKKGRLYKDVLLIIAFCVAALELSINTGVTSVSTVKRSDYTSFDEGARAIIEEIEADEGENLWRAEKNMIRTKNDGAWIGFNSISTFSSVGNANLTAFYKTIGLESSTNAYGSMGKTFFTNMILGVKYIISDKVLHEEPGLFTLYAEKDGIYVYENACVLPLGYVLPWDALSSWTDSGITPLENQNQFASLVSGVTDLFEDVTPVYVSAKTVTMTVEEAGYYYAYSPKNDTKEIKVSHGDFEKTYQNLNRDYTMEVQWVDAGESITFENVQEDSSKVLDITLYRLREDRLKEVYEAFSAYPITVTAHTDTSVNATVLVPEEGGTLFTSIPYEEGWELYVDGEKHEIYSAKDAYIAADLSGGTHELEFKYHVPLFVPGLLLTLLSAAVMVALFVFDLRKKRAMSAQIERIAATEIPSVNEPVSDADLTDVCENITSESSVEP